ncbi:MAG: rod shape-determining protein RodA [Myxococcales bacterium]|nr:rod shape-determining protein RodA [Myxococcales bacterium]
MSALRRTWSLVDGPLTAAVVALIGLGLLNLYSATRVAPKGMFSSQLMWIAIGLVLLVGVAVLDQQLLKRLAWPAYLGVTGLLVAVLLVGKVVNGSRRWFGWGSYGIQPSELMKLSLILLGAHLFSSDPQGLVHRPWRYVLKWHALWIVPALLILKQPDLGTALLCGLLALSLFFLVPLPPKLKLWVFSVGLSGAFLVVRFGLKEYQKKRLLTFLHPELDPTGTGYHARQALFAIGSGRLFGKGYLRGTQNHLQFLPEHWTDFPFAVWAEEWGLCGCLLLLACFLFLILWTLHIASACRDRFGRYLVLGCAALLFWHVTINIAMVIGLAPVVGVTLPLVSYGGSSVLTVMAALGLVYNVSARRFPL